MSYQSGGAGGAGVAFAGSGGMLTNAGTIRGGVGGGSQHGAAGLGGAGVSGAGMTIVDTGAIAGGLDGTETVQADAVTFTGGANTLALGANAQFFGALDVKTGTLTFDQSAGAGLPSDVVLGTGIIGAGTVVKVGTGALTLSAASTYTGGTTLDAGTLIAAHANAGAAIDALGTGTVAFAGGTLAINAGEVSTLSNALSVGAGGGMVDGDAAANGGASITTVAGPISGSGALTLTDGTFTLTGNNSAFTGAATITSSGTVLANGANTLSSGAAYTLGAGASLRVVVPNGMTTARQTVGSLAGGGTLSASGASGDTASLTTGGNNTSTTYSGVIADAAVPAGQSAGATLAIEKTGTGTLTLSGTNTYTGGTTIDAGTLAVGADANLGATAGGLTFAGGTLETTTGFTSARTVALGAANGTVRVDTGTTTLSGTVSGAGSLFKAGAGTLTLSGTNSYTGGTFIDAGTLSVAADGSLGGNLIFQGGTLETTATLASGRTIRLDGAGTIQVDSGTTTLSGAVSNTGALTKTGAGTLALSATSSFSGGLSIGAGTVDLQKSGAAGSGAITFAGASATPATLTLEAAAQPATGGTFGNTLTSFGTGDTLDLKGFAYAASDTVAYAGGVLTVTDATATETFTLATPTSTNFSLVNDGAGGTDVTVCYCSGTLIRVLRDDVEADVAVEDLAVGDLAVTASGAHRPIRWLGSRLTHCRRHPRPHEVMPVRVAAHAFGENRPARDLRVSPGHAICVDVVGEVLIPAAALVNGTTIQQVEVDEVTYWHVELEGGHDILVAENMPAESYLEMGNRSFFAESGVVALDAAPDADTSARTHADFCRPFHMDGPLVDVVRSQLRARAVSLGWSLDASDPFAGLHLMVDGARVAPVTRGLVARFHVPGEARDVWLVSATARPCEIAGVSDGRDLGVCVGGLTIDDGFTAPRTIDLADPLLCAGFHQLEDGARRWTAGRARLPAALWSGHEGAASDDFFLRVDLAGPALPRWVVPAAQETAVKVRAPAHRLSLVASA